MEGISDLKSYVEVLIPKTLNVTIFEDFFFKGSNQVKQGHQGKPQPQVITVAIGGEWDTGTHTKG